MRALVVLAVFAACAGPPAASSDASTDGAADLRHERRVDRALDRADASPCGSCPDGYACRLGGCVLEQGPCASDDDCQADTFCVAGRCDPYGGSTRLLDPLCTVGLAPFAPEELTQPVLRCSWSGGPVQMTPVVADLDADGHPEILVTNFANGNLVVLDRTCKVKRDVAAFLEGGAQLAVADLDGDKQPEIVGIKPDNRVVVMDASGAALRISDEAAKISAAGIVRANGGAAIANLDGQGVAEIVYAGMALRFEQGKLVTLFNVSVMGGEWGVLSAVADVDLDGKPEVIVGNQILDGLTGADKTPPWVVWPPGYPAVAQLDASTPEPEIVLHSSLGFEKGELLRIYHPVSGALVFGPPAVSYGRWGGPPTVADFDGDGLPEVGVAGPSSYRVYDPGCGACTDGVLWQKSSLDMSSGSTGSSVFDFNGDGRAEVIYRDECWLRVYDGQTGQLRFAHPATSLTLLDNPVVADLDRDGHADLVVPTMHYVPCANEQELKLKAGPQTQGVLVLEDEKNRWMPSRGLWNQHTYHITNVNDDLTVPAKETPSWLGDNSYRKNVQGAGTPGAIPGPDLTAALAPPLEGPLPDCSKRWPLSARVCNRGAARALPGVLATFFAGAPKQGGTPICTVLTAQEILPGACLLVGCDYLAPPAGEVDLWLVVDPEDAIGECKEKNNTLHLPGSRCPRLD